MWVKSDLALKQQDVNTGDHKAIQLSVQSGHCRSVALCAAYRPGTAASTGTNLLDYFDNMLYSVRQDHSNVVIAGDFNVYNHD